MDKKLVDKEFSLQFDKEMLLLMGTQARQYIFRFIKIFICKENLH